MPSSGCSCPDLWTGPQCEHRLCAQGQGVAPTPPQPSNNACNCTNGARGVQCSMCTSAAQCQSQQRCDTSIAATGRRVSLACSVTGGMFTDLISDDRPGVSATLSATCDAGTNATWGTTVSGRCFVTVWRLEPNATWIDAFFSGTLAGCAMHTHRSNGSTTYACKTSAFQCGANPPNVAYRPFCIGSIFGENFLPIMTGPSSLRCGAGGRSCAFALSSSILSSIPTSCVASACL